MVTIEQLREESRRNPRRWKQRLAAAWQDLDKVAEDARRRRIGIDKPDQLKSLQVRAEGESWVTRAYGWACPRRGLGDFARFALARYIYIPEFKGRTFDRSIHLGALVPLPQEDWVGCIKDSDWDQADPTRKCLRRFDTQLRDNKSLSEGAAAQLQALVAKAAFWDALAVAINTRIGKRGQTDRQDLTGSDLRNLRFAGPTAIDDFLCYLNSGFVPVWQAPYGDDLSDLGVHAPQTGQFVHEVKHFPSDARRKKIEFLVEHVASPPDSRFRVSCLYSTTEPHGLIAACNEFVRRYAAFCIEQKIRRLPVVYVPVGLDMQAPHVSRREVIRDLHHKLCVARSTAQRRDTERRRGERRGLPKDATGEQIDAAVDAIRTALARAPTLLVFGIHHVPATEPVLRAIEEEILDSPLPYAIDRLMPESGIFKDLVPTQDAYATQAIVLADARLDEFSTFKPYCVELPACTAEAFPDLLEWTGYAHVQRHRLVRNLQNIASNEIELSIVEAVLALAASDEFGESSADLLEDVSRIFWDSSPSEKGGRTPALLEVFVEYLNERAGTNPACAWFITVLQIIALASGGLRRETAARVLAGYVVATGASNEADRPAWLALREAALWTFPHAGPLAVEDVEALTREIVKRLEDFVVRAIAHVRVLDSTHMPALDKYPHLFESPEVPAFTFEFEKPQTIELRFPLVQTELRKLLRAVCPQKHALLQRLLAEEFLRRAAIVQRHGTDRDQLSLVEKRYAIAALEHSLDSLEFARDPLLSREGLRRSKWLLEPSKRLATYQWIYRWLYVAQIDGDNNALSRQHGAELLKIALLKRFLSTEQGSIVRRISARTFQVRSQILLSLAQAGLLSCDSAVANEAMAELGQLRADVKSDAAWLRQVNAVRREVVRLNLDGIIMYGHTFAPKGKQWSSWKVKRLIDTAFEAQEGAGGMTADRFRAVVKDAIAGIRESAPPFSAVNEAARTIRRQVCRATAQHLYDYLMRYAELLDNSAERQSDASRRTSRKRWAIVLFELAEALRQGGGSGDEEHVLDLSARPARSAGRLCLALGGTLHKQGRRQNDNAALLSAANRYFERAAYYGFHFIGNLARYQVERVASLIVEASTIRIRGQIDRKPRLDVAMEVIKTAERALIHYPSRLQLWIRLYIERAKLFRDRAVQVESDSKEAMTCAEYCKADVESVLRLAGGRKLWNDLANRVLSQLPRSLVENPTSRRSVSASRSSNGNSLPTN